MFVQLFCRNNVVHLSYQCYVKLMDDLLTSLLRQLVVKEMRAAFWLPLNLINPRHSFFKYMPELFLCISDWRMPFVLDEIGLFHRIVVVLDSRQEGKK